jgi:hypothetical protein
MLGIWRSIATVSCVLSLGLPHVRTTFLVCNNLGFAFLDAVRFESSANPHFFLRYWCMRKNCTSCQRICQRPPARRGFLPRSLWSVGEVDYVWFERSGEDRESRVVNGMFWCCDFAIDNFLTFAWHFVKNLQLAQFQFRLIRSAVIAFFHS